MINCVVNLISVFGCVIFFGIWKKSIIASVFMMYFILALMVVLEVSL